MTEVAGYLPPAGHDGTPHESVNDVFVRIRQVMSVTEQQFTGQDVVFIASDSDTLSIMQAAILGADLRNHRRFAFKPGAVLPLQLSADTWDEAPRTLACPQPPQCL